MESSDRVCSLGRPSLLLVRQAHATATAEITLRSTPTQPGEQDGLAAFQDERRWFAAASVV